MRNMVFLPKETGDSAQSGPPSSTLPNSETGVGNSCDGNWHVTNCSLWNPML